MAETNICPDSAMTALATCNKLHGWPAPAYQFGTVSPENEVVGYYPGQLYAETDAETMWAFFGTPGESTGWVDLTA